MPGMSADISVLIRSDKGVVVPSKAVSSVRTRSYIKVLENGEVKTKRIKIGANDGVNVAVLEGLNAGEQVVVPGATSFSLNSSSASAGSSIVPINIPGTGGVK
jgi:HlyD family secretion protein